MSPLRRQRVLLIALAGTWCCALAWHEAHAAPPLSREHATALHGVEAASHGIEPKSAAPVAERFAPGRLDLTPPSTAPVAFERPAALGFTAMPRHGATDPNELPGLGQRAGQAAARIMSTPEALAHNFRREGLPVARLFQSENSLVHIGLSPKGKPGLWIVEKLH